MSANWLPQLRVSQPYTMCPLVRLVSGPGVDCCALATPAFGTNVAVDRPDVLIRLCLTAPAAVQRAARAQGVRGVVHVRVPGLAEALERSRLAAVGRSG